MSGRPPIISVHWRDSHVAGGWVNGKDIDGLVGIADCETVGFLVREDDRMVAVALSYGRAGDGTEEEFGDIISIPKSAITARAVLSASEA